jgi:hypothetical protein
MRHDVEKEFRGLTHELIMFQRDKNGTGGAPITYEVNKGSRRGGASSSSLGRRVRAIQQKKLEVTRDSPDFLANEVDTLFSFSCKKDEGMPYS